MTTTIRVVGSQFRYGELYLRGDTFEGPERLLERHPVTLAPADQDGDSLDEADDEVDDEVDDEGDVEVDPDPSDLTVAELEDRLAGVDDADLLAAILAAESEGEDRDTAIAAIEDRLESVTED